MLILQVFFFNPLCWCSFCLSVFHGFWLQEVSIQLLLPSFNALLCFWTSPHTLPFFSFAYSSSLHTFDLVQRIHCLCLNLSFVPTAGQLLTTASSFVLSWLYLNCCFVLQSAAVVIWNPRAQVVYLYWNSSSFVISPQVDELRPGRDAGLFSQITASTTLNTPL